jgi:hypothetical protein
MFMRMLLAVCCSLAALTVAANRADAHVIDGTSWYFQGVSRADDNKPSDPMGFIITGGSADSSQYSRSRIETHMADDWDNTGPDGIGGSPWRKDSEMVSWCKNDQKAVWVNFGSTPELTSDKTDWHGGTSKHNVCGPQHHARFWDDWDHRNATTGHGDPYQWVIGGVHHEKWSGNIPDKKKKRPVVHKIDRDWTVVRIEMVDAMHEHCSIGSYKHHSGADLDRESGQGYVNDGWIARISLHHVADGGCAGQLDGNP